jgi:hypothetical protein
LPSRRGGAEVIYTGRAHAEWFAAVLLWLPKRCPELSPVGTRGDQGKDILSSDKQSRARYDQVGRPLANLGAYSNQDVLPPSSVLSDYFWPRRTLSTNF